jgi:uncharacterized membrane protein (DUF106 family)
MDSKDNTDVMKTSVQGKEGSFKIIFLIMLLSLVIAFYWPRATWISGSIHAILDPTLGFLLNWSLLGGMFLIVFIIALITTLVQKYATDQGTIKELKAKQKEINKKTREFHHDPQKMMEIQKELMPISMKMMKLSMRPIIYTGIPFILSFRWFIDYFTAIGDPKLLGFLGWFWFYLIFVLVFGMILRKILKVV